ncbi:MAG: biotin--[acetyl-CoA-carboxylase] ligase, partial [Solirubrobacterales bacterium]
LLLPLAVPLAVCEAVEAISAHRCGVKWPNDVWIGERKCAGVLIESRPQDGWAVIGVGLNVAIEPADFPEELRGSAISVGGGAGVTEALEALNPALSRWAGSEPGEIVEAFAERDVLRGREIRWDAAGEGAPGAGVADGVDERGNLVVLTPGGERISLGAGEIHLGRLRS